VKTACPTCGAEVEFRYDDSFVRVCGHCRAAVVRTDRGVESLGRVADLAPSESPLRLFLEGRLDGLGFMTVGRAQIQHGAGGTWEEWYAKFDDSRWGWISEAQGRFYVTFETGAAEELPSFDELEPGERLELEDGVDYTVAEKGTATLLGCDGEIPYRFVPGARYLFADAADGTGRFGTIDFGDPLDEGEPTVYLGRQVTLAELGWGSLEAEQRPTTTIASGRLACPSCDGSIELRAPGQTLRMVCPYCEAMLDVGRGTLQLLAKREGPSRGRPIFPLGSKATFDGVRYTLIGFVRRHALTAWGRFPFDEYLLHEPKVGFRWLVESDGHWSFVTTLPAGAVGGYHGDPKVEYRGVSFKQFQSCPLEVTAVFGEVYWKVAVGETVYGTDYVAPPAMLSCEQGANELNWSLGVYQTRGQVEKAFGTAADSVQLPAPDGIAPNQPFKHRRLAHVTLLGLAALGATALLTAWTTDTREVAVERVVVSDPAGEPLPDSGLVPAELPPGTPSGTSAVVYFTKPFHLDGRKNIEIVLTAPDLDNEWMAIGGDLVNEGSGDVEMFDVTLEHWSGVDSDGSWTEATRRAEVHVGARPEGDYVVRLELQRGKQSRAAALSDRLLRIEIRQDVFRTTHFLAALGAIALPGLLFGLWQWSFERRRWKNSDQSDDGDDDDD
jgi:hypothetical protein